jgi:hypothetical protein
LPISGGEQGRGGPRLQAIRHSAQLQLAAIAPDARTVGDWFLGLVTPVKPSLLGDGIGSPLARLAGHLLYTPVAAAVNFPKEPDSRELRNKDGGQVRFERNESVTVRVTYLYPCSVPIANLFVCSSLLDMTGIPKATAGVTELIASARETRSLNDLRNLRRRIQELYDRTRNKLNEAQRNFEELQAGAEQPNLQLALLFAQGARFHVLRREATLPIHGASYEYPTAEMCKEPASAPRRRGVGGLIDRLRSRL